MKMLILFLITLSQATFASEKINFNFKNKDLSSVIERYAKHSGKKIVFDPNLKGKISIISPQPVTIEEAFSLLSQSLARNGIALSNQNGTLVAMSARNIQRSYLPVVTELPKLVPEQMITYIVELKNASAQDIMKNLRILPSKDGEMSSDGQNRLVFTDWISNLHRVNEILAELDKPQEGKRQ